MPSLNSPMSSVLDRLVDACSGASDPQPARVEQLISDIEELLNTCCVADEATLAGYDELGSSLLAYGAPAPASLEMSSHLQRQATARQFAAVLRRHETRISNVRVAVEEPKSVRNEGRFRIDATLPGAGELSLGVRVRNTSGLTHVTAV